MEPIIITTVICVSVCACAFVAVYIFYCISVSSVRLNSVECHLWNATVTASWRKVKSKNQRNFRGSKENIVGAEAGFLLRFVR